MAFIDQYETKIYLPATLSNLPQSAYCGTDSIAGIQISWEWTSMQKESIHMMMLHWTSVPLELSQQIDIVNTFGLYANFNAFEQVAKTFYVVESLTIAVGAYP